MAKTLFLEQEDFEKRMSWSWPGKTWKQWSWPRQDVNEYFSTQNARNNGVQQWNIKQAYQTYEKPYIQSAIYNTLLVHNLRKTFYLCI